MTKNKYTHKYLQPGNETEVWQEIINLDLELNDPLVFSDVSNVLNLLMDRVAENLEIISNELMKCGYKFENFGGINEKYVVFKKNIVSEPYVLSCKPCGEVPLSLKYFYSKIKNVDLRGQFESWDNPYFLDPLFIHPQKSFEAINETPYETSSGEYYVLISPDEFVKEDVSGDVGYGVKLSEKQLLDNVLVNFNNEISFIDYLRISCKWAGLTGLDKYEKDEIPLHIYNFIKQIVKQLRPF